MAGRLKDKTAFVTAAAQGIGKATALAFASEGALVWAVDINCKKLSKLDHISGINTRICDVTDTNSIDLLFQEIGRPDIVFNCVGYVAQGTILECSDEDWDFSFDLNV